MGKAGMSEHGASGGQVCAGAGQAPGIGTENVNADIVNADIVNARVHG
jgi:hypothetical protein